MSASTTARELDQPAALSDDGGLAKLSGVPLPIVLRPARPWSDDQLIAFSRANKPFRIEQNAQGEIIVMTPVGGEVSTLEAYLSRELDFWTESSGHGISFSPSVGFRLGDGSVLSPDASWVPLDRWNALTRDQKRRFPPFCPDFLVEVRSPSDSVAEVEQKMVSWIDHGAQLAWLIDPERKLGIIYRPGQSPETMIQPQYMDGEGPIAGFRLKMERFWA